MSKIGKTPITIPEKVEIKIEGQEVKVKGPKGQLTAPIKPGIRVVLEDGLIKVERENDKLQTRAYHGLVRSLIQNQIEGVTDGYQKTLKLVGTGYRVSKKGAGLEVTVGYSHPVAIDPVKDVELSIEGNDTIIVKGMDKQKVGQVAADIRAIRKPEPYKGKGIRYADEVVKIKPGKAATE